MQWRTVVSYGGRASACASQNIAATARPGLLSQGSYVAPSPQRRIPCKQYETELTYCPIYGFKPSVFSTKGLTQALFCFFSRLKKHGSASARPEREPRFGRSRR